MIQIYNTLSRQKEAFQPLTPGQVRMYVCGMTVYDYCHIGHARVMVVFDVVNRYLRASGYDVTYVRNITDIDDKIIQRAVENGEPIQALTERFIAAMHEDAAALNTLAPDLEPRATDNIDAITQMISDLIERGHAYAADNGDVYFAVASFENYGRLSGRQLEDMRAGERVEVDPNKRDPMDFVLWKAAKSGEPAWTSPWGEGRPGWHIECSAMSTRCLGHHFDIHGGGMDLQFPHHENEIAQSECATGETFVNVWMHNGFVRINDEKMSKSLGNFFTIRDVMESYRGEEIRFFMLGSHYRSPLNYSLAHLDQARAGLTRLYTALRDVPEAESDVVHSEWESRFRAVMDDDFNTAEALAVLFELAGEVNKAQGEEKRTLAATLRSLGELLGILQQDPAAFLRGAPGTVSAGPTDAEIVALIEQRAQARADKNFAESDRIRDLLAEQGIVLEDKGGETSWRRS